MSKFVRTAVAAALILFPLPSFAQAPAPQFFQPSLKAEAQRFEAELREAVKAGPGAAAAMRTEAQKQLTAGDAREAVKTLRLAVVSHPADWQSWLALAKAYRAVKPDNARGSERYDLPYWATAAAMRAYETAQKAEDKAEALAVLAETLKARQLWRPAIEALKASVALNGNGATKEALEKLKSEHGFRMVDYKVDADAAEPRLCLNFSEAIAGNAADLAKFVAVDGKEPQNVSVEGNQLCIEGLTHGRRYEVKVRAGVPANVGENLEKEIEIASQVRDRKASVRVTGRAYVLPRHGQQGVPIVTTNTGKVAIEIFRIGDRGLATISGQDNFLKQLDSADLQTVRDRFGQSVWKGDLTVANRRNEDVTTAVAVGDAIPKLEPGVYILAAGLPKRTSGGETANDDGDDDHGRGGERATQWFIVSDLGLSALSGQDGIHGFVRAIGSAEPQAGVTVKLVAKNNEVLATAKTDAGGHVRFDAGLKQGTGGHAPALIIAETGSDYAFLDLQVAAFDLTDRGVKGREMPGALDGYLFPERGVYRPGEAVHLTGLVRDKAGAAATLPVTLIVARPDGVEHRRTVLPDQGLGGRALKLDLAGNAMTGTWRARIHADPKSPAIAEASFLVEDFVPERIELKLDSAQKVVAVDQAAKITVDGRYLYGAPGAGLDMEGEIIVRPRTTPLDEFPGFRFGRADEKSTTVRRPLEGLPKTSDDGKAEIVVGLPPVTKTARLLEADVLVRLREPGGRTIERRITRPVSLGEPRVGIKPRFTDDVIEAGDTAEFEVIRIDASNQRVDAKQFKWELYRLDQRWQWFMRDGNWGYDTVTTARKLTTGVADSKPGEPARIATDKLQWGRYRLDVTASDGGPVTSVVFASGWYGAADGAESPETLDIALDKQTYKAGETARLRINAKDGGRAHVTVLAGSVLHQQQVVVPAGGADIAIPVDAKWLPGAYVSATLYRPIDQAGKRMPSRSVGMKWLGVDTSGQTLKVALDVPAKAKPSTKLAVSVKIAGLAAGEEARVTVAAVDVGILNLTRFESPAPEKWFHAQRRLGLEMRDLYGRLIDGMRAERGALRSGGDSGSGMRAKGTPPVEATLALFSGIAKVDANGTARVEFDMPDFNGTVRLMAVAWSGTRVGSVSTDVIVRDQVALTASAPRFLTLGDETRIDVDVHNLEAIDGTLKIAIEQETAGGQRIALPARDLALKTGERRREAFAIKPADIGTLAYTVRVTGASGLEVRRKLTFDVKPPSGDIRRTTVANLAPKSGKLTVSKDLLTDLIPSSTRITLSVGPTAAMDVAGLLGQLDRYPYGCAEQTTSRALPLLYVNDIARRLGIAQEAQIKERIQKAVDRVFDMQDAAGAFGIWGPQDGDIWLSAYVTDFLTRAKESGFVVRPEPFNRALDRLTNYLAYVQDFEAGGEPRAYALYVLARNGRAPMGDLRYYVDTRLERFTSPLAQAQLGAALSLSGDKERAEKAFKAALARIDGSEAAKQLDLSRADYGSFVRDGAGLLTLAAETGVAKTEAPKLASVLAKAFQRRAYTSTQEQAWMLLAARALSEQARGTSLAIDGVAHAGELQKSLSVAEILAKPVTVANSGDAAVDAVVTVLGSSLTPEPAVSKGFTIERTYYTLDGKPVDMASVKGGTATLQQNDRLVVVVRVKGEDEGGRILVVDRLPAGFEVENPRLVDSGDVKSLDFLKREKQPAHTEFRDDRVVAAFDFFGAGRRGNGASAPEAMVAYIVRVVTPGTFIHPAATVEDMYRPERHARSEAGRLVVTGAK